jgi:hypothetical protein
VTALNKITAEIDLNIFVTPESEISIILCGANKGSVDRWRESIHIERMDTSQHVAIVRNWMVADLTGRS